MPDLTGQIAIVTGAAAGIGEVIAKQLAGAGARVYVADIDGAAAQSAAGRIGPAAQLLALDITDPAAVAQVVASLIARNQPIDILVNNAGLAGKATPIWEQTDADWRKVMAVNTDGPFYLCRAVLPHMRSRSYGRIVNLASVAGKEGNPNMVAHSS